jgi:hypothetical protein
MKMESCDSWDKKIWSTENTIRPNRDDIDHVLIMTIDVDSRRTNDEDDIFLEGTCWPHPTQGAAPLYSTGQKSMTSSPENSQNVRIMADGWELNQSAFCSPVAISAKRR